MQNTSSRFRPSHLCYLGASVRGVLQQVLLLDDVDDRRGDCAPQRVAAVRAACRQTHHVGLVYRSVCAA